MPSPWRSSALSTQFSARDAWASALAGHANGPEQQGLSAFGREVLSVASELGMIVDLSGCSPRGVDDVLASFDGPVHASSTNCRALHDRPSNFADEHIRAIGERGGVIGTIVNARSVGDGHVSVAMVADHIQHVRDVAGPEAPAIAPNIVEPHMYPKETYERVYRDVWHWTGEYPEGLASLTGLPALYAALTERGWSRDEIAAVHGANAARFLRSALGGKS